MNRGLRITLIIALAGLFVWISVTIFSIRFESGNLHPEYSSRRADPFGSKALFDTISQLLDGNTQRIENPLEADTADGHQHELLLVLGTHRYHKGTSAIPLWNKIDDMLKAGSSVVIALKQDSFPALYLW